MHMSLEITFWNYSKCCRKNIKTKSILTTITIFLDTYRVMQESLNEHFNSFTRCLLNTNAFTRYVCIDN